MPRSRFGHTFAFGLPTCFGWAMDSAPADHRLFRRHDAVVAESLVAIDGAMLWCDITAGFIAFSRFDDPIDGSHDRRMFLPAPVCSFHPARSGYVVSLGDRVVLIDASGRVTRTLAEIDHAGPRMRLNEGKVDPAGRWVTGSMELSNADPIGAFYVIDGDGRQRTLAEGVGTANGLEWSPDGTRIYFTDTSKGTIYTGDYGDDRDVSNVEVFHEGPPHDGLVMDSDGHFWAAIFGESRVIHLDADGRELFSVHLPAPNLTSVAFHRSTLYVASAREKLDPETLEAFPLSGSIFSIETSVTARAPYVYDG